jgi:hypothetical protein
MVVAVTCPAEAANDALLRLLQVLRDRGSISPGEYEEIRAVADASDSREAPASPVADVTKLAERVSAQEQSIAEVRKATEGAVPPLVNKALAGKWYERIGLRGYTQFRYADVISREGLPLEVPNDRSVNENESFMIRRGRFVWSGDVSSRLALYAQVDFVGSAGGDYVLQTRDLYGDIALDAGKAFRVRLGQSKVPFGWVNLQSSQNRAPLERPDALNSAVEGERDLGASLMWASSTARQHFRDIAAQGLKHSGDYGVLTVGAYSGQGLNRSDQDGDLHYVARLNVPFKLASGQFAEVGIQAYRGRFTTATQAIAVGGVSITPAQDPKGTRDERLALSAIWYPQPIGFEAEWSIGRGPALSEDYRTIETASLHGGYVQVNYRTRNAMGTWFPFTRWNYYDGARKFARNAPLSRVNEIDIGLEFAKWAEVEITAMFTRTLTRTRTGTFPYGQARDANRLGVQVQWNY